MSRVPGPVKGLRADLAGITHIEAHIPGRDPNTWTPMCEPNTDWIFVRVEAAEAPTCFWCIVGERLR